MANSKPSRGFLSAVAIFRQLATSRLGSSWVWFGLALQYSIRFPQNAKNSRQWKATDGCILMLTDLRFLSRPGCLDRFAYFVFSRPQMLLRFRAMSCHIVVVRGASIFHLLDRFLDVVMALIQVVPVMHFLGNRDSCNESQARRKNGSSDCFIHSFPLDLSRLISCTHSNILIDNKRCGQNEASACTSVTF